MTNLLFEHSAFVRRSYPNLRESLLLDAHRMLETASADAADRIRGLVEAAETELSGYDGDAPLTMTVAASEPGPDPHVRFDISWQGDRRRRMLANVRVSMDFRPRKNKPITDVALRANLAASTEEDGRGRYVFDRQILRASLLPVLQEMVRDLEEDEQPS